MCTDHPIVQRAGRPHRGPPHHHLWREPAGRRAARRSRQCRTARRASRVLFRDRDGETRRTRSTDLELPMPGRHNALNATVGDRGRARARHSGRRDPQGARRASAASSAASPAPANGTASTIIDDYGHHPVEIAAVLKAAREFDQGPGDRGGAAAPLHAAAVAVRAVLDLLQRRRRGDRRRCLSGRRGADRGRRPRSAWSRRCARAAIARSIAARRAGASSPASSKGIAKPGDYVVCLGAGNITQWAYALPGELKALGMSMIARHRRRR